MSTPPVTDPTLNAGEAGEGGMTVRHCLLDYASSSKFRLQAPPAQALYLEPCGPSTVFCIQNMHHNRSMRCKDLHDLPVHFHTSILYIYSFLSRRSIEE